MLLLKMHLQPAPMLTEQNNITVVAAVLSAISSTLGICTLVVSCALVQFLLLSIPDLLRFMYRLPHSNSIINLISGNKAIELTCLNCIVM